MGFLSGKKILVTGLLSNRSIAFGVASGATAIADTITLRITFIRFLSS